MGELRKVADDAGLFGQMGVLPGPIGKKGTDFTIMLKVVPYIDTLMRIKGDFPLGFFQGRPDIDDAAKRSTGLGLGAADGFFRIGQLPVDGLGIAHRFEATGDFLGQAGRRQAHQHVLNLVKSQNSHTSFIHLLVAPVL